MFRVLSRTLGALVVLAALAGAARANGTMPAGSPCSICPPAPKPAGVPEIDPGSIAGAATLLSGGMLMLTQRLRRR